MSSENVKPDQIQASVAAALSRLRGDLGPSAAAAPKIDEPGMGRPANDVRADPFFRSIQSPAAAPSSAGRDPIPMSPFARMQASQEPITPAEPEPSAEPATAPQPSISPEPSVSAEPSASIDMPKMPEMPEPERIPDLISMPEPATASSAPVPQPAPAPAVPEIPAGPVSPLARMMRTPGAPEAPKPAPMQRDLLADLPPPPISEPLTEDTDSAMRRRRRNRRLLGAAIAIVILALGAWLWTGGQKSTEVPVIAAEATPEKVKPADEGGLQVPNQNVQILENMEGTQTQAQGETVMPEPEQPVTPPAPSAEQAPIVVENNAAETVAPATSTSEAPAVDTPPAPEAPLTTAPLPEQENASVATNTTEPPSPQAEPAAPAPDATQTAEAPTPATTEQAPPAAPAPQAAAEPTQPEPAPAPQPAPTATQEAAVTPTTPVGNTRVQLAAGKSEESVRKDWAAMQKAHPDLLGGLTLTVQRVDKGAAGIFYRLQAGPLADKDAAKQLCASLKKVHQDCIVVSK